MILLHANCVAFNDVGVLLRGQPGIGKSDLTLRLIERGYARFVADDQTLLRVEGQAITAAPAPGLEGLLHVTQVGIIRRDFSESVRLGLIVDLVSLDESLNLPLLPEMESETLLGVALPRLSLCALTDSAPEKVRCALEGVANGEIGLPKPAGQGIVEK